MVLNGYGNELKPGLLHIDLSLNHSLSLLNRLFILNEKINEICNNIVTTTNTINDETKHVQMLIQLEIDQFDVLTQILGLIHEFERLDSVNNIQTFYNEMI